MSREGARVEGYGNETYGERWADVYDEWTSRLFPADVTAAAVEVLAELAGSGRVLELAIGTGRIALPLAQRGLEVHGIDASQRMVDQLREKPGGQDIPVTMGDFADVEVDSTFALAFVVFNTFFALRSQDDQIRCFRNVAEHLDPGGHFVIEAFVPDVTRFHRGQTVRAERVGSEEVQLDASQHDPVTQTIRSQHMAVTGAGIDLRPTHLRYAWPSELDLMGRLAGLRLRERWGGWDRSPFTAASTNHVSVYEREP